MSYHKTSNDSRILFKAKTNFGEYTEGEIAIEKWKYVKTWDKTCYEFTTEIPQNLVYNKTKIEVKESIFFLDARVTSYSPYQRIDRGVWYLAADPGSNKPFLVYRPDFNPPKTNHYIERVLYPLQDKELKDWLENPEFTEKINQNLKWDLIKTKNKHPSQPRFFTEGSTVNPVVDELLKNMPEKVFSQWLDKTVTNGWSYDEKLKPWLKATLIPLTNQDSKHYLMRFQDHTIVIKPPQVGISSLQDMWGKNWDKFTKGSATGWSGVKDKKKSLFDGRHKSTGIDEFVRQGSITDDILNFMATGKGNTGSGGEDLTYRGTTRLTWIANPNQETEDLTAWQDVIENSISCFSSSPDAGGARIGRFIFDNEIDSCENIERIKPDQSEINKTVLTHIIDLITPKITEILESDIIYEWLETGDEAYRESCEKISESVWDIGESKFQTFVKEHGKAIPHIKGGALKEAIYDQSHDILRGYIDVKKILEIAKTRYVELKAQNKESLIKLSGFVKDVDWSDVIWKRWNDLSGSQKGFLFAINLGFHKKTFSKGMVVTILDIKQEFNSVVKEQREIILGKGYADFAHVKNKIPENRDLFAKSLSKHFHVNCRFVDDDPVFVVHDTSILEHLNPKVQIGQIGKEVQEVQEVQESTTKLNLLNPEPRSDKGGV